MIAETEESESLNKEHITENIWLNQDKLNRLKAKEAKLNQWKIRQVYEEIEDNEQECISFHWVVKKIIENKPEAKARLRTGGFEEEKNNCTDSPTNSREDIWVVIALTSSKKWTKKSGNIKTSRVWEELCKENIHHLKLQLANWIQPTELHTWRLDDNIIQSLYDNISTTTQITDNRLRV